MAKSSLPQVKLFPKELTALSRLIELSFIAFEVGGYPPTFESYLTALIQIIQLGSAATMHAAPKVSITEFSEEMDKLSGFLRDAKLAVMANTVNIMKKQA